MRHCFAFAGILLLLWAPRGVAGGINLNWGNGCWSDGTPLEELVFGCNSNAGSATLTCSYMVDAAQPAFVGLELELVGTTQACTVPAWWQMWGGECRGSALSASEDFTSAPQVGCVDPWFNRALGGIAYYYDHTTDPTLVPDRQTQLLAAYALPQDSPVSIEPGIEYYAATIRIGYAKTVGEGSCGGCQYPMMWGLYYVKSCELTDYQVLYDPLPGGNQCVRWQHSDATCYSGFWRPCTVPAASPTWGRIKSLYR